jgi:RHS repeat-associated protein
MTTAFITSPKTCLANGAQATFKAVLVCACMVYMACGATESPSDVKPPPGNPSTTCNNTNVLLCCHCDPITGKLVCPAAGQTSDECPAVDLSCQGSLIENIGKNHHHTAWDYYVDPTPGKAGCSSCGGHAPDASESTLLPTLGIKRTHNYRFQYAITSSFGPGVYSNYDVSLGLYVTDAAQNTGYIRVYDVAEGLHDPQFNETSTIHNDNAIDGVYWNEETNVSSAEDIRLTDINGNLTPNHALATQAVLRTHDGHKFYFEIINTTTNAATSYRYGRMTRWEDRNGNATLINYQFMRDTPDSDLNFDRSKLFLIDSVKDSYGHKAIFHYQQPVLRNFWVVDQIDLPNGTSLHYQYDANGLAGVIYPDGETTTIGKSVDPSTQFLVVHYDDAASDGTHRRKDAWLTQEFELDPATGNTIYFYPPGQLRRLYNGAGELAYFNQEDVNNPEIRYVYEGGHRLDRIITSQLRPISSATATSWVSTQDPSTYVFETIATYVPNPQYMITEWTDNLGRSTFYDHDLGSAATTKVTYHDGSVETTSYNSFREPLQHVDRIGRTTGYTYDSKGNILTRTAAVGTPVQATWTWSYNSRGQIAQSVDANGNATDYAYTPEGYLASITEPPDNPGDPRGAKSFMYDSAGRMLSATDEVGRTLNYTYDVRNRVTSIRYSDGSTDQFTYGTGADTNLIVQTTDRTGNVTMNHYDADGRKILETIAGPVGPVIGTRRWSYLWGTALRERYVDNGNNHIYSYDYKLRLIGETVQANTATLLTEATTFDSNQRTDFTADPYNRKSYYLYDINDRAIRMVTETVPGAIVLPVQPGAPGYQTARDAFLTDLSRITAPNAPYIIQDITYDAAGQSLAQFDGRNVQTMMDYDSQGRLIDKVEAAGSGIVAKTAFTYDPQGNRTLLTKPRQFTENSAFQTSYTYTGRNLLKSKTEAAGKPEAATENYTYYLDMRPKDTINARGNVWTKVWKQCCARLGVMADPEIPDYQGGAATIRPVSLYEYNFYGDATHVSRARNLDALPTCCLDDVPDTDTINETTTRYDARHRPIAQTVWLTPLPAVDEQNPFIYGEPDAPAGAVGLTTRWVYDDDLTDGVSLDATYASFLTDLNLGSGSVGSAVEMTDPAGDKSVTVYDAAGRVVKMIDGNGNSTKRVYDGLAAGIPGAPGTLVETSIVDALGHVTKSETDGAGRILASVDALANVSKFSYDAASNRVAWRDPNGIGQDCVYDARNRQVQCTDTHGDTTRVAYDTDNNIVTITDALSHSTSCSFDARDRKISCTDRIGGTTSYTYDVDNNLTQITDAQGAPTTYIYDARNLLSTETFPDLGLRSYTYDGGNRLITRLDQANATTNYSYDMANRLKVRGYLDNLNDTFAYDLASRLTSATSQRYVNTTTRIYDAGSRLTSETQSITGFTPSSHSVAYSYDAANRQIAVTYPDGSVVARSFTNRNQLDTVTYNGSLVANFAYDGGMRKITENLGNGLTETRTYRNDNLNNTIKVPNVTDFTYSWDANKRKLGESDGIVPPVNSQTFGYDNEDRLIQFNRQNGRNQTWSLSLVGDWNVFNNNGAVEQRIHNSVHELTKLNNEVLGYDTKGNLTQNNNDQQYAWDFENRLSTAMSKGDKPNSPAKNLGAYAYDALGRRISKRVNNLTTVFVSDGLQEIAEYEKNGNGNAPLKLARTYVYGSYIDEPLLMVNDGVSYYYHTNNLYSIAALTNAAGVVVERYTYDPYGKVKMFAPNGVTARTASSVGNPFQFCGYFHDIESGLDFCNSRYYSRDLGRWLSRDRIGYLPNSYNLYQYVNSHPLNATDPFGFAECDCDCKSDCDKLDDLKDKINGWVNDSIKDAQKAGKDPGEAVGGGLGGGHPWTKIETDIDGLGDKFRKRKTQDETKYKGAGFQEGKLWAGGMFGLGDYILNPCIKVCGKCIGSDKMGHFLQQGLEYYQEKTKHAGDADKGTGAAEKWSDSTEKGAYGLATTGVYSTADMEANRQGGKFYEDLKNNPNMTFDICNYLKDDKWCEDAPNASPNTYGAAMDKLVKANLAAKAAAGQKAPGK